MSAKSTLPAARLKHYLRMLMQQQSWILSKKSTFIILFSGYCYVFISHLAIGALLLLSVLYQSLLISSVCYCI